MRDSNPIVVLVPGVGRITFATDKTTARLAGEFYGNAINVMRGAEAIGDYIGLDEQEAFDIEYWLLEEAKLQRMPAPKPLVGKSRFGDGRGRRHRCGNGGTAAARRGLRDARRPRRCGAGRSAAPGLPSSSARMSFAPRPAMSLMKPKLQAAFEACAREFGGLDILVANAGIASSAPIEDTTMELWNRNYDVLAQGYFLTAKHAWPLLRAMKDQGGSSVVFIGSKNAVAAASGASAYASRPRQRPTTSPAASPWKVRPTASASTSSIPMR